MSNFTTVTESVLTFSIIIWYGKCSAEGRKALNRAVRRAVKITGLDLLSICSIYRTSVEMLGLKIIRSPSHPVYAFLSHLCQEKGCRVESLVPVLQQYKSTDNKGRLTPYQLCLLSLLGFSPSFIAHILLSCIIYRIGFTLFLLNLYYLLNRSVVMYCICISK